MLDKIRKDIIIYVKHTDDPFRLMLHNLNPESNFKPIHIFTVLGGCYTVILVYFHSTSTLRGSFTLLQQLWRKKLSIPYWPTYVTFFYYMSWWLRWLERHRCLSIDQDDLHWRFRLLFYHLNNNATLSSFCRLNEFSMGTVRCLHQLPSLGFLHELNRP